MSRSKSRWKGALLAAVATAAITPLAAKAQSMTVGLSLSATSPTSTNFAYIAPDKTVPLYVWATVTEAAPVTASNIAGLQYLYYNVNANASAGAPLGAFTSAQTAAAFTSNGSQNGNVSSAAFTSAPAIAVGGLGTDSIAMTAIAKPRTGNLGVFSTASSSNVVVSGNSVSFLVETLNYKPSFTPATTATPGAGDQVKFTVAIPSLPTGYAPSNYFANLSSTPTLNQSIGASNTFTSESGATAGITFVDAQAGDANLDGFINSADFGVVNHNFGLTATGDAGWTNGDVNTDGFVNSADFGVVNHNFGVTYGPSDGFGPSGIFGSPTAQIGSSSVPEPASLGLLSIGALALLRRRRSNV